MSRYLIGMSGDKDKMIEHLLKCESRMLEQLAEIKDMANTALNTENMASMQYEHVLREIMELCDVYVDKRSEEEKMFDSLNESMSVLEQRMTELQSVVRAIKEEDE